MVIAMLIKDWQFSFSNCDLVNPPLVHDLKQNVASYFNPLFNMKNRMWLFLSLYGSLDNMNRKPLSYIQAKGIFKQKGEPFLGPETNLFENIFVGYQIS